MPESPKTTAPLPAVKVGDVVLERYKVIEQIAAGGHSVVFRGADERLSRPVCIKVFSGLGGQSGVGRTSYEHFVQEAFALSRLTHPNTLRIYDFGHLGATDAGGMPLQVCEFMNGGTLSNVVREQGKQTVAETARVISAMCAALAEAHGLGIVHRDIKPQNILFGAVGADRLPKLADFGIAKWQADDEHNKKRAEDTQIVAGQKLAMYSPSWAAPEQLAGQTVSAATDIYSLATVAVYMLSGRAIFADEDVYAGYKKRRHAEELVQGALKPLGIGAKVIETLTRALAFDPKKRIAKVDTLGAELGGLAEPITEEVRRLPPAPVVGPSPGEPLTPPTTVDALTPPPVITKPARTTSRGVSASSGSTPAIVSTPVPITTVPGVIGTAPVRPRTVTPLRPSQPLPSASASTPASRQSAEALPLPPVIPNTHAATAPPAPMTLPPAPGLVYPKASPDQIEAFASLFEEPPAPTTPPPPAPPILRESPDPDARTNPTQQAPRPPVVSPYGATAHQPAQQPYQPPAISQVAAHHTGPQMPRTPWMATAHAPGTGVPQRLYLADQAQVIGDRRASYVMMANGVADLVGTQGSRLRVSMMIGATGNRMLHVKGMSCFVAHLGGRPSPALQLEQSGDLAIVTARAQEIGHVRVLTGGSPDRGALLFPLGQEVCAISLEDCIDPILFDFGPGSDAYFVYTRGRVLPRPQRR